MTVSILVTKLFIPPTRPELVRRPRLIERLNTGLHRKLTLISAPAGYGKTTLISEWVTSCEHPIAWLSLDEEDNDPSRFLVYLITAVQTIQADIGERILGVLQSPQPPPSETILANLLNEITTIRENFALILDDYHFIDSTLVDKNLTFMLEHLPPQLHLVIATREDPNLPLARLRAQGQLTELRVSDLRFTPSEAAEFLNQVMSLNLSVDEISSLERRTEGWIAGLQLAALSMQGREDIHGFIKAFAGDNRYIVDYLVEEVLKRQPERIRSFLMQTSILDRLCAPLCDAVTGQEDSKWILESLERDNLFVVPLDEVRQWYRYHHLFAEVLHTHLMEEQPDQASTLHRQASEWYQQRDLRSDAIRHALAAGDFERATDLVELAWPEMNWSFQSNTWLGWVNKLPDKLVRARPVLCMAYAWALLNVGEIEKAETRLRDAARWLEPTTDKDERPELSTAEMVVVDDEQFQSLPATIASARAYIAQTQGNTAATVKYAQQALDLLHRGDHLERGRLAVLLGLAYWTGGDLEAAHGSFIDAMTSFQLAGNILYAISFAFILADIRITQGRLHDAIGTYENSLKLAIEQTEPVPEGIADLYLGLSELHRELGDHEAARQYLQRSEELDEQSEVYHYRLCRAKARIKEAQGDLDDALELLDQAERWLYYETPIPDVRPTAALKARIWAAQGRLHEALGWAQECGLSVDDDLSYLREFEHVTLARVLIAQYTKNKEESSIHEILEFLERLLAAAQDGDRVGSMIEIFLLQALAHQAQGDIPAALVPLERALSLAEAEGYIRVFVDEGLPMAHLLSEAAAQGVTSVYTGKLLAAFEAEASRGEQIAHHPPAQPLVEPLSERELEVLRLIAQGLSNREIGERLFLALNTVKGYNRRIFGKLEVQRRTEAVARARELGIL